MRRSLICLGFALLAVVVTVPAAYADGCEFGPTAGAVPLSAAGCGADSTIGGPPRFDPTDMAMSPDGVLTQCASAVLNDIENVSAFGGIDFHPACDFAGDDFSTLYCLTFAIPATLVAVDSATCNQTVVGTAGNSQNPSGMAWDPSTGTMYLSTTDVVTSNLYTIDVSNASTSLVGRIPNSPGNISIGVNKDGDLFGHDIVTDSLHAIDKTTGSDVVLGPVGFDANFAQGMDFDAADDTCYIFGFNNSTFQAELWECDTTTGAGSFVGVIGSISPGGLQEWTGPGIMATNDGGCALTVKAGAAGIGSGGTLPVELHLMHTRDRGVERTFKIMLVNGAGDVVSQMRTDPVRMRPNQLVHKKYQLRIPDGTPAGNYSVRVLINGMEQGRLAGEAGVTLR